MREKAQQIAVTLGIEDFQANNGWLMRFKQRHEIKFFRLRAEKAEADHQSAAQWKEEVLPKEIQGVQPRDIFNADETGLAYKALPNGTYASTMYFANYPQPYDFCCKCWNVV